MNETKSKQPNDRHLRAWELYEKGWKQTAIAEALGVTRGAVSQWINRAKTEGREALRSRKGGGPKPRLNASHLKQLGPLLAKGAEHFGFRGDVWTRKRVAQVIKQSFGVSYSPTQIGRILKKIDWSCQKPLQRASQRDEAVIERWRNEKWFELKKKPSGKGEPSCL